MAYETINEHPIIPQEEYWNCFCLVLTKGFFTVIDIEDYSQVIDRNWHVVGRNKDGMYAATWSYLSGLRGILKMHNLILPPPNGMVVDHKNCNSLDNRRCNLRLATQQQNQFNKRGKSHSTSKFKGVSWRPSRGHWRAMIFVDGKDVYLGSSRCEVKAAKLYNEAAKKHYGEFAWTNPV